MKRLTVLVLMPLALFTLERVNLIKDHSFEKDSEVWHTRLGGSGFPNFVATVSRHDSEKAFKGDYSGSCDTRSQPADPIIGHEESAYLTQGFFPGKKFNDVDSIIVSYSVFPYRDDFSLVFMGAILLHLNAQSDDYWKVGYGLKTTFPIGTIPHYVFLEKVNLAEDTTWFVLDQNIYEDSEEWLFDPIPLNATLDSIIFWSLGSNWNNPWAGQKIFWDDVRLMGYADYDVGVKEITSPDGGEPYTPEARIKNFGREPADSFLAIATILNIEGDTFYSDTLTWSLPADTEDTITFMEFPSYKLQALSPGILICTLSIRTVMDPDECDEDDELLKELLLGAVNEPPPTHPNFLDLRVNPVSINQVHASYSLPANISGSLTLFDLSGRCVEERQVCGFGSMTFNSDLSTGVYIVKLKAMGITLSRKVVVVR